MVGMTDTMATMITAIASTLADLPNLCFSLLPVVIARRVAIVTPVIIPNECATRAAASGLGHSIPNARANQIPVAVITAAVPMVGPGQCRSVWSFSLIAGILAPWVVTILIPKYVPSASVAYATALKPTGLHLVSQYSGTAIADITAAAMAV